MCSLGYIKIAEDCFHFSEDHLSWDEAQASCKKRGDQLAVLGDAEAFMKYITNMTTLKQFYFVGGRKDLQGGHWKWEGGNQTISDVNFATMGGNCLCIWPSVDKFHSKKCSHFTKYLCQRPSENYYATTDFTYIIVVICIIIMLLIAAISIYIYRKRNQLQNKELDSKVTTGPSEMRLPTRHDSENSLYGQTLSKEGNLSGRHDSENSLYEQSPQIV
ncbi:unnamed protein product, partial [Meganyctiphanes norvegica]